MPCCLLSRMVVIFLPFRILMSHSTPNHNKSFFYWSRFLGVNVKVFSWHLSNSPLYRRNLYPFLRGFFLFCFVFPSSHHHFVVAIFRVRAVLRLGKCSNSNVVTLDPVGTFRSKSRATNAYWGKDFKKQFWKQKTLQVPVALSSKSSDVFWYKQWVSEGNRQQLFSLEFILSKRHRMLFFFIVLKHVK